jgi:hypothetical protein
MNRIKFFALLGVLALLALSVGGAGAQGPTPPEGDTASAVVAAAISYQGRLTNLAGVPLSGTYDLEFTFWSASATPPGVQIGATVPRNGQVITNGLYSTSLGVDPANVNGQELWLQIRVRPSGGSWETLSPRVQVLPTAYALSLRPGAQIQGDPTAWDGWVLKANMTGAFPLGKAVLGTTATGSGVYGESTGGYGVYGYTQDGYAVRGYDGGATTAQGYGGYFESTNGVGVYGYSGATSNVNNYLTPGVYGRSANGAGVYGVGPWEGVYGYSPSGPGVYGETDNGDFSAAAGVWGSKPSGNGAAIRGTKYGSSGYAIYGTNSGSSGSGVAGESTNWTGVWGESTNYDGMHARTGRSDHYYGLYSDDYIWALGYTKMGTVMQVVQNGGSEALEPGDVAVFSGMAAPLEKGGPPVVQVARATAANSTAVAGVVYSRFNIQVVTGQRQSDGRDSVAGLEVAPARPVPPGEYLLLVMQGPVQVKASAVGGVIRPGDLLSSATTAGYAAKAAAVTIEGVKIAAPGTVFGKALESLDADQKLIYVFVTLQ